MENGVEKKIYDLPVYITNCYILYNLVNDNLKL